MTVIDLAEAADWVYLATCPQCEGTSWLLQVEPKTGDLLRCICNTEDCDHEAQVRGYKCE